MSRVHECRMSFIIQGSSEMVRPPALPNSNHQLYDSCVDDVTNPSIFVVFERDQCYPRYLISYKVKKPRNQTPVARPAPAPTRSSTATYNSTNNSLHTPNNTQTYQASAYVSASNRPSAAGITNYSTPTYQPSCNLGTTRLNGVTAYHSQTYQPSSSVPAINRTTSLRSATSTASTNSNVGWSSSPVRYSSGASYTSSEQKKKKCVLM